MRIWLPERRTLPSSTLGDGVVVAARLEPLADPGGICISGRVREDATGKLDLSFRDLGEQQLKNIAHPVRVYALNLAAPRHLSPPTTSDRALEDLFALQDEVTSRIARALSVELAVAEAARPVEHLDALDCILRGRAVAAKPRSSPGVDEAIGWYERALTSDPASAEAQARLAVALVDRIQDFVPESSNTDIERAEKLARQALMSSPRSTRAHYSMAEVLRTQRRYTEAISEYEAVLALDRNFADALADLGRCRTYTGPVDDAILAQQHAIRLSPRDPRLFNWYFRLGEAHLIQSRLDEAIDWLEKARSGSPAVWYMHAWLAAAYAHRGNQKEARAELAAARSLQGSRFDQGIAHIAERFVVPETRERFETTIRAGLRLADMP